MGNISNIDDLLMGVGNSQQPMTPEHKDKLQKVQEDIEDKQPENPSYDTGESEEQVEDSVDDADDSNESDEYVEADEGKKDEAHAEPEYEEDEYGNKKERIPPGMKDRLDRKEKQHQREIEQRDRELQALRQQLQSQGASREVQQAVKDFKYNPNDEVSWEQQLSDFVKQTVNNMHRDEEQKQRQMQEQQAEHEFAQKFTKGMDRFVDFREVVGSMPMDNAMTLALRGMADPSAFIYAASKRQPQEIERISKLRDPYARMVEMGKLEERMRRNKPTTKAPRPLGRTAEDATTKVTSKQKDMTGDDLLAKADAKRLATVRKRHGSNR
jgi:hypothetical protein